MRTFKAIVYVRRSKEGEERTVSLVQQAEACARYLWGLGWLEAGRIVDDGVSGGCAERAALRASLRSVLRPGLRPQRHSHKEWHNIRGQVS